MTVNWRRLAYIGLLLFVTTNALAFVEEIKDGPPSQYIDVSHIPDAVPKLEPLSPYGNPVWYEVFGKRYYISNTIKGYSRKGYASWYGNKFHGKRTSSGEDYDMFAMTAANKTLPIPCYVRVTNLENGRQIIVKVNDRGPFHEDRIIDLSYAAAQKLGMLAQGTAYVQVDTIDPAQLHKSSSSLKNAPSPTKNIHRLYLQIGAFGERINAQHFAEQIKRVVFHPVDIHESRFYDRPIYRVKIGPLIDTAQASTINQSLKKAGMANGILVQF